MQAIPVGFSPVSSGPHAQKDRLYLRFAPIIDQPHKHMYKAVFLDMDGTLLKSDHSVSEATQATLRKLTGKGIPVILVSARPLDAMLPTANLIGLEKYPLMSLNGSYIVQEEKAIFQAFIDLKTTAALAGEIRPFQASVAYYVQREWFAERSDIWTEHEQKIMDVKLQVQPFAEMAATWAGRNTGPNKLMVMSEPSSISAIQQHLLSLYQGRLNIYPSKPTYLEIMDIKASKSNALRFLIEKMKISREETIAMGDNYNDGEMIKYAGMGVAMGNAPDEIKALADYVTDTNNEDGVRKALERFFPEL
jgi:Cof subfamily protein (haloacid dehalogenase superfamily)